MAVENSLSWPSVVAVFAIVLSAAASDSARLWRYSTPAGLDGYYYVSEVDAIHRSGHLLYSTATPLFFYFASAVRFILPDTVLAIKLVVVSLHFALSLLVFGITARFTRSSWLGLLAVALSAFPVLHLFLISEYLKQLLAVVLFLAAVFCWMNLPRRQSLRITGTAIFALGSALSHASGAAFVIIACLSALLFYIAPLRQQVLGSIWLRYAAVIALWTLLPITHATGALPHRIQDAIVTVPHWPIWGVGLIEKAMAALIVVGVLALDWREEEHAASAWVVTCCAVTALVLFFNPFLDYGAGSEGLPGRLSNLSYIALAVLGPVFVWRIGRVTPKVGPHALFAIILISVVALMSDGGPRGITENYLRRRAELVAALPSKIAGLPSNALIVAPHGYEFLVTSVTGIPAQHSWPKDAAPYQIYWLLHSMNPKHMIRGSILLTIDHGRAATVLVSDADLRAAVNGASVASRANLIQHNKLIAAAAWNTDFSAVRLDSRTATAGNSEEDSGSEP